MLNERLPHSLEELFKFKKTLAEARKLPKDLRLLLELIPASASPLDVLKTITAYLGTLEPEEGSAASIRLVAIVGAALFFWQHFHENGLMIDTYTGENDSLAQNLLKLLYYDEPKTLNPVQVRALDLALIVNAMDLSSNSIIAARLSASESGSDIYSCVNSAMGCMKDN